MQDKRELLINYINNVLYHPERAKLNLDVLDEADRELGEGILRLGNSLQYVNRKIGEIVGQGYVETSQRILVTRETQQDRFDSMVHELRKRTSALENERNLFVQFTENASERIVVLDEESGDMLFANKVARSYREATMGYIDDAHTLNAKSGCNYKTPYKKWIHTVEHPERDGKKEVEYFQVHSIYIVWEGRGAIAHMFSSVTELQRIQEQANRDVLTGAFNRRYAMQYLDQQFGAGADLALAFVDVDYLKYCNDTFGHSAGDDYLLQVAKLLQRMDESGVICRMGGDEFLLISENKTGSELRTALEQTRELLDQEYFDGGTIHKSFSYGVVSRAEDPDASLQKLLGDADERMYQNKLENKRKNHLVVKDERL